MRMDTLKVTASWRWGGLHACLALLLAVEMVYSEPLHYQKVANSDQGSFDIMSSKIGDLGTVVLNNTKTGKRTGHDHWIYSHMVLRLLGKW